MKLKFKYFIPLAGFFKYFNEYYSAERRGTKESNQAMWMEMYHLLTGFIVVLFLIKLFL